MAAEPLHVELKAVIGMLSDFAVHFTPEHVLGYTWEATIDEKYAVNVWFGSDDDSVAQALLMLVGQHRLIFRVFDRCLHGQLYSDGTLLAKAQTIFAQYKNMLASEGFTNAFQHDGDFW